jgi:hypothetical protein
MKPTLPITGSPDADKLLNSDPLALVVGMLLDPHILASARKRATLQEGERADQGLPLGDLLTPRCKRPGLHRNGEGLPEIRAYGRAAA